MNKSIYAKAIVTAAEKGYTVDKLGNVFYKNKNVKIRQANHLKIKYYVFSVRLYINGKSISKMVKVHRLQAFQKYGNEIFKKGMQVRHHNGNHQDNSAGNILIGTNSQNQMDISKEVRIKRAANAASKKRVLTDRQIIKMNIDRDNGMTYKQLMEKYKISSKGTISFIFNKALYNPGSHHP